MPVQRSSSKRSVVRPSDPPPAKPGASDPARAPERTTTASSAEQPVSRTRTGAAWVGIALGAVVLVLLIVFMLQNTDPVEVVFFGLRGSAPLGITLLIAGVGVGIVALVVGSLRIGQLRRRIGADRKDAHISRRDAR